MRKEIKAQIIESISAQLQETPNFYITDISGLNAEQTTKLRRACFEAGIKLTVVKNTLFNHVIESLGNEEIKLLVPTLVGNTAIMYTEVANAPAKLIKKLQKEGFEKPVLKGAMYRSALSSALTSSRNSHPSNPRKNSSAISSDFSSPLHAMSSPPSSQLAVPLLASSRHFPRKKRNNINNLINIIYYGRCKSTCRRVG